MKYYFSGINHWRKEGGQWEQAIRACPWRLQSCYPKYMSSTHKWTESACVIAPGEIEMMFDSGAFTAWSKKESVKLNDLIPLYDEVIEKYEPRLKAVWFINLDVIPGSRGVTAQSDEIEQAMLKSDENFQVLQKRYGARVLPVFHQNEPKERLLDVAAQAEYICVSPRNDLPEKGRIEWSLEAHELLHKHSVPWAGGNKTHGLATTGRNMLTRVPWFSADSASWVFCGANGGIMVLVGNQFKIITISSLNPKIEESDGHFDTLPKIMQDVIISRIERRGMTPDQLRDPKGYGWRMIFNAGEIVEFCAGLNHVKINQQESLFEL